MWKTQPDRSFDRAVPLSMWNSVDFSKLRLVKTEGAVKEFVNGYLNIQNSLDIQIPLVDIGL